MGFRNDAGLDRRDRHLIRPGRVMLDPLTQVRIRVLMLVLVRGCEFMMDSQRSSKRRQGQQNHSHTESNRGSGSPPASESLYWHARHGDAL
ncbi:MAG TPA: hypothetical protein VGQ60_04505 [Nitrospiraceae bacterium]|jgi:hypothetical protein|nr:hypothetical protein [Nitrospiraceae bacterium]